MADNEMCLGRAIAIFMDIDGDYSGSVKHEAIKRVANMETHNSIPKAQMIKVIKYLLKRFEDGK